MNTTPTYETFSKTIRISKKAITLEDPNKILDLLLKEVLRSFFAIYPSIDRPFKNPKVTVETTEEDYLIHFDIDCNMTMPNKFKGNKDNELKD